VSSVGRSRPGHPLDDGGCDHRGHQTVGLALVAREELLELRGGQLQLQALAVDRAEHAMQLLGQLDAELGGLEGPPV
jgi:hypothetical protein